MLKSIRAGLFNTTLAMAPFLLSACDNNTNNSGTGHFEIVILPALICTAFLADNWLRRRSPRTAAGSEAAA